MDQPISSLNLPKNKIDKLENSGFYYCNEVEENIEFIRSNINIPEWASVTKPPEAKTALELLDEENKFTRVTTFIPELDSILSGQITPGCVTELAGFPDSGKTRICSHLAVGVQGEAVFIHTNKNLNPERLKEIAAKYTSQPDAILDRIVCVRATDPSEVLASVHFLESWLPEHENVKLLIIDSISWPFKQQLFVEQTHLRYRLIQNFRILSKMYNFGIVVTNDLTTKCTGNDVYHTSSFGDSFHHIINNRILLSKNADIFSAKVLKSTQTTAEKTVFYKF